jgi:Family of unknown function (DUF5678)
MSEPTTPIVHEVVLPLPAPTPETKFQRERRAFQALLPILLPTHRDQYVAIHEGQVVEWGDNLIEVAERAYDKYGYVPIYVGLVTDKPIPPVRLPSVRTIRKEMVP